LRFWLTGSPDIESLLGSRLAGLCVEKMTMAWHGVVVSDSEHSGAHDAEETCETTPFLVSRNKNEMWIIVGSFIKAINEE
jgi:hypothetical protein